MRRIPRRLRLVCCLLLASAPLGIARAAEYDWCSPLMVRPDQRQQQEDRCIGRWGDDDQIAASSAEVVVLGDFTDVANPRFTHTAHWRGCRAPEDHAEIGKIVQHMKEIRAKVGGPPLWIVHMTRFDLVSDTIAALPGFNADFLVRADRPFRSVIGFYETDRSSACQPGGCHWSDSFNAQEGKDAGPRLRDSIDASGGKSRYETAVYYTPRPAGVVATPGKTFYPNAAIADLGNPAYRAWRVAQAKLAIEQGHYDAIALVQKFSQFIPPSGVWIASATSPDVEAAVKNEALWTARPVGYGYTQYLNLDDPSTPDRNEWLDIRDVARSAKIVLVDRSARGDAAAVAAFEQDLRDHGAHVVSVDTRCGLARH